MKSSFAPVLLCLALLPIRSTHAQPATSQAVPVADDVQVEVRAAKDKYLGGEPVILTVVLRNNMSKPVSFLTRPEGFEFQLRFTRAGTGRTLKAVATKKGDEDRKSGVIGERIVPAKGQSQYKIVLSRAFDMTRAGTYSIVGQKNLKLEALAPGGNLIGAATVAREVKVTVSDDDVAGVN